jgi:hypothetical protein
MEDVRLVVATMTLARGPEEEALIRRAVHHLARPGRRIVAADGGSRPPFVRDIARLQGVTLLERGVGRGLLAQVQASFGAAQALAVAGAPTVPLGAPPRAPLLLYTEPDKAEFFADGLDAFLEAAEPRLAHAGVVLAGRDAASFATYPATQQAVERQVNDACAQVTGLAADYSYGPFLLRRELVPYVLGVREDVGWGWRPYLFAVAHRLGLGVEVRHGHHPCPEDQRVDDEVERRHRGRQLEQNLRGLAHAAAASSGSSPAAM